MKKDPRLSLKLSINDSIWSTFYLVIILLLATACQADILNPPRLATETAIQTAEPTATAEPLFLPAPTATTNPQSEVEPLLPTGLNESLTVWINETSPEHEQALKSMMEEFEQANQVTVELVLVAPSLLPKLMETAVLSDTLPDIVLHPATYSVGWAEREILDVEKTNAIIDQIGRDTFNSAALELATFEGETTGIPSDGYQQILLYRADWLEELGQPPPDNYDDMLNAAESIFNPETVVSGFVIPTESNLETTHKAFEHIAIANGCELIDDSGEVLILDPLCQEAIDFYFTIVNRFSPIGVQTDTSTRNAYLSGQTGMIIYTPSILPMLAGLVENNSPDCLECLSDPDYLAQNSGIITRLKGRNPLAPSANFGEVTYLGITRVAPMETTAAFAEYWFNQGYPTWLEVDSERKVPMRWGTTAEPRIFIDNWGKTPLNNSSLSLEDIFGEGLVDELSTDIVNSGRWGFSQGQGALITKLYEELTLSVTLQEMLSGYFGSTQTLYEIYQKTIELIPNYAIRFELQPTPGPEE